RLVSGLTGVAISVPVVAGFVLLGAAVLVGRSLLDVGRKLLETKPRARGPLKAAYERRPSPAVPPPGSYETTKGQDAVVPYARAKNSDRAFSSHPLRKEPLEVSLPQCGEIVVERLTGNRAMVIRGLSPEEVTCRFGDGRLEDRFTFELEPLLSLRDPRGGV